MRSYNNPKRKSSMLHRTTYMQARTALMVRVPDVHSPPQLRNCEHFAWNFGAKCRILCFINSRAVFYCLSRPKRCCTSKMHERRKRMQIRNPFPIHYTDYENKQTKHSHHDNDAMKTIAAKVKRVIALLIATSIIYVAFSSRLSPSTAHAQFQSTAVRTAFTEEQQHLLGGAAASFASSSSSRK
jgi:hypothetical protein